jgi:pseudouridine-5'-phosphate glycosidase
MGLTVRLVAEIDGALRGGRAVVALESSVLAQGLPSPANREAACRMVSAVRSRGAVPAITGVVRGTATAGLEPQELERFLRREAIRKVSARDLAVAVVQGADGATTVAGSLAIARAAGIEVCATGGIGGVHRETPIDESADLLELARSPAVVVCAGAKSILDLPATAERLETLGIPVVGYRTWELPGFFSPETGIALSARAESAAELAAIYQAHRSLGGAGGMLVVQPPPAERALPRALVDAAVAEALVQSRRDGVRGAAVTPYLLAAVERATGGRSLGVNLALLESNAALAAEVAVALAAGADTQPKPAVTPDPLTP